MPIPSIRIAVSTALAVLALCACERPATPAPDAQPSASPPPAAAPAAPAPALEGFQNDAGFDAQGYYMPQTPVKVGSLVLRHIAFGAPSDFRQWEAGERSAVFGPVLLFFEDETSPSSTNELGQPYHAVSIRVLPTAYRVFPGAVSVRATDPRLGEIGFVGSIDGAALSASRDAGPGDSRVVMTGTLRVGDAKFENVRFTYFMGD